jgi:SnoaL-like protein
MIDDDTRDRAEIYDLFNRYVDAVAGRQWELLDEVFTEDVTGAWLGSPEIAGRPALVSRIRDVIEPTAKTHLLGNYTATIDGDVAEASVWIRVYRVVIAGPGRQYQKIFGSFRARLIRTRGGWRFRYFGSGQFAVT